MPTNCEEEEKKFFENNYDYDPQFEYECDPQNNEFIRMFPAPKFDLLPQAQKILDTFLETYGSETNYQQEGGRKMDDK